MSGPDGRIWYTDNQGDFVGTSKMFELKKDAFYGHPAGLVDLPGMTPDSPEIQWEQVAARKEQPVILFPHNRVANSPGNPAWITQNEIRPVRGADADRRSDAVEPAARRHAEGRRTWSRAA